MKKFLFYIIITIFFCPIMNVFAQQVNTAWVINNFTGYPVGVMIGLDTNDNIFVTGQSGDNTKIITTKFDTAGNLIWQRFFSIPSLGVVATWLSMDPSGNVIVTGYPRTFSSNPVEVGLFTLKYDNNGNLLWDKLISGTWAFAVRSIIDQYGNIYVTGRAWQYTATYDFVTVKYAPDGTQLWFDTFDQNSGFHTPTSMALDQAGNLFISGGGMSGGLITVMYNSSGVRQWVREKPGSAGHSIKVDGNGGIFVTGSLWNNVTGDDIMLLKYNLSGNLVLEKYYDFGNFEYGKLINFDSHSNIFITGQGTLPGQFVGWLSAKFDSVGNLLWYKRFKFNQSWEEYPYFALVGPEDELYVTGNVGQPYGGTTYNGLETVRYNSNGSNPWVANVNLYGGIGKGLALGSDLSLYAVGAYYYSVLKYTQSGLTSVNFALKAILSGNFNGTTMVPDTVSVELHSSTTPYALVESKTVLLDASGSGNTAFTTAVIGNSYYIVLKFKNGIETWSATPQIFSGSSLSYDFTTAANKAYGNNLILIGTKYCIISGDANQDGSIDALDRSACWNDRNQSGYYSTDLNGDGVVDALDRSIAWNNRNLSVQKPALMASLSLKAGQDNNDSKVNSKGTKDLKLDGSNAKKTERTNNQKK